MTKIEIINGTYGFRPVGSRHPIAVARGGICDVPDGEAQRLYRMGVARPAVEEAAPVVATPCEGGDGSVAGVNPPDDKNGAEDKENAHLDAEQLKELTNDKLRALAEDMGIDTAKLRTKAQLIAAITDAPLENPDDDENGDNTPPAIGAEPPVL